MTNLQTVPSKTSPAESGRTELGNFFQMPAGGIGGNLSNADFDSFLGNRESSDQAEELREEQEAAKKRKKPVEAGLATPLTQQEVLLQELEGTAARGKENRAPDAQLDPIIQEGYSNTSDISDYKNDLETLSQYQESARTEDKLLVDKGELADIEKSSETYSDIRGIESAPNDSEMIASATLEATELPPQALREPSITTINRLTAFASLERTAVAPVAGTGSSSESGSGNTANGIGMLSQFSKSQTPSPSAQASALFKSLGPELDKFKQTGGSQIQLDLPVGEDESVRIKLSIRGGEIRSTFITESPELREALQKAWPEFSQNSRDRGFRMGDPAFQQSFQENNANLGQNNRRQSDAGSREVTEIFAPVAARKPVSKTNLVSQANSTALWA
jgi:hypothetical protein